MNTSAQAITAGVVAVVTAIIGLGVAAGLDISQNLQDALIAFITVVTPVVIAAIAWIHHTQVTSTSRVEAARAAKP